MSFNSLESQTYSQGWLWAFAVIGWSCLGCAPADPPRQAVQGTVTLDGNPVSGLTLVFTPVAGEQLGAAAEVVNGKFSLSERVGPSLGKHQVTVSVNQPDLEDFEALRQNGKQPFVKLNIPAKYTKPGALEAEVLADENNVFDFQLGRK